MQMNIIDKEMTEIDTNITNWITLTKQKIIHSKNIHTIKFYDNSKLWKNIDILQNMDVNSYYKYIPTNFQAVIVMIISICNMDKTWKGIECHT